MTSPQDIQECVRRALAEDIGSGDITAALIPADLLFTATVITRENAVLCGVAWFNEAFHQVDVSVKVEWLATEGQRISPNQVLCTITGPARALLSAERTALNFLQTLSGTATLARCYADAVAGTTVRVLDTRKTLPGLRTAQKYAVSCGGCHNHRHGLYDGILIKENHIMAAGSISAAVRAARQASVLAVEVEVETLDEVRAALSAGADILLLDDFSLAQLRDAVLINAGQAKLEVSGGVTLENIRHIAETGIDYISVGALTKHLQAVDLSMRFAALG